MEIENSELWQSILSELELQISRPNFLTWLKNSRLVRIDDATTAYIALPNNFAKEWIETKYHKMILGLIRNHLDSVKKVEYLIEGGLIKVAKSKPLPIQTTGATQGGDKQLAFQELKIDSETNLNPRYTLSSYVVGGSNELVFSAATAVIQSIGNKYNPFFIYGGVGLGKTHLIQAIGNEIKALHQNKVKVKYVTSEKFTNEVISSMRNRRMEDFKNTYRNVDVLIVDDIQFIVGKERTEEEFFHTFNALYEGNKQIILSSDRPPKSMPALEERLRSRFEMGMIADISYPDYETRVAIIKTKLQEKNISFSEPVIDLIARRAQRNIREVEGIINKIIFHQTTYHRDLDMPVIEKIVGELTEKINAAINPTNIINAVAAFYEVSSNDIVGRARNKELIEPRQVSVYLLREMLNMSYPFIANKIGSRDHTTAIYSYKKILNSLEKDHTLNQRVLNIKEQLNKLG